MKTNEFTSRVRGPILARKNFNKVFCIGYNKTGTTTLEKVLRIYGFNLPNQQEQEFRLTQQTFETNYEGFKSFVSGFEAFQDLPFSQEQTYVVADALFPNSKFILTERESEEWFESMCRFTQRLFKIENINELTENDVLNKFRYLYPGYLYNINKRILTNFSYGIKSETSWNFIYEKNYFIKMYEERNNQIKKYFMNTKSKLLVVDITKEKDTAVICKFLNIPEDMVIEMPHSNKS
tara:strand:+ start:1236 stop:1943 length:708 start_codon:yes stop_codon:yes gene_type:complete